MIRIGIWIVVIIFGHDCAYSHRYDSRKSTSRRDHDKEKSASRRDRDEGKSASRRNRQKNSKKRSAALSCRSFGQQQNSNSARGDKGNPDLRIDGSLWKKLRAAAERNFARKADDKQPSSIPQTLVQIEWQAADGSGRNGTPKGNPKKICPDLNKPAREYRNRSCYCLVKTKSATPTVPPALNALSGNQLPETEPRDVEPPAEPVAEKESERTPERAPEPAREPARAKEPATAREPAPVLAPPKVQSDLGLTKIDRAYVKKFLREFRQQPRSLIFTPQYQAVLQSEAWQRIRKHRDDLSRRQGKVNCTNCH